MSLIKAESETQVKKVQVLISLSSHVGSTDSLPHAIHPYHPLLLAGHLNPVCTELM